MRTISMDLCAHSQLASSPAITLDTNALVCFRAGDDAGKRQQPHRAVHKDDALCVFDVVRCETVMTEHP